MDFATPPEEERSAPKSARFWKAELPADIRAKCVSEGACTRTISCAGRRFSTPVAGARACGRSASEAPIGASSSSTYSTRKAPRPARRRRFRSHCAWSRRCSWTFGNAAQQNLLSAAHHFAARTGGARDIPSRAPDPISHRCARARCARASITSSTAKRPGTRSASMPIGSFAWCARAATRVRSRAFRSC